LSIVFDFIRNAEGFLSHTASVNLPQNNKFEIWSSGFYFREPENCLETL